MAGLVIRWLPQREARAFVKQHHSHHGPMRGAILCLGAYEGDNMRLCAVAALGRPSARMLDRRRDTAEVTRHCTDRTPNVAAKLYAQCRRVAQALGFDNCITYTLATETGISLKVAGWRQASNADGSPREVGGGSWSRPSRPRVDKAPTELKHLWVAA